MRPGHRHGQLGVVKQGVAYRKHTGRLKHQFKLEVK